MKIVLTGATGAIGGAVLHDVQSRFPDAEYVIISRRAGPASPGTERVVSDLTDDGVEATRRLTAALRNADAIIHMAADVRWATDLDRAHAANVAPTDRLLDLAVHNSPNCHFIYVSTAYAASPERAELEVFATLDATRFANAYEYTKRLAEEEVRRSPLAWTIVRPSLVIGSTIDGEIGRHHGLYHLLDFGARGCLPLIPAVESARIDFVPVDYVARVTAASVLAPAAFRKTIPAVSGPESLTVRRAIDQLFDIINRHRIAAGAIPIAPPKIVRPESYRRFYYPMLKKEMKDSVFLLFESLSAYHPYFTVLGSFEAHYDPPPRPEAYFAFVVDRWCCANPALVTGKAFPWNRAQRRLADA